MPVNGRARACLLIYVVIKILSSSTWMVGNLRFDWSGQPFGITSTLWLILIYFQKLCMSSIDFFDWFPQASVSSKVVSGRYALDLHENGYCFWDTGGQGESVSWRILGITVFTLFKIMMHALSFLSGELGWGFCVRVCVCVLSWSQAPGIFLTLPQAHQHIYLSRRSGNPSSGAHSLPRELAPEFLRSLSYRRSCSTLRFHGREKPEMDRGPSKINTHTAVTLCWASAWGLGRLQVLNVILSLKMSF